MIQMNQKRGNMMKKNIFFILSTFMICFACAKETVDPSKNKSDEEPKWKLVWFD